MSEADAASSARIALAAQLQDLTAALAAAHTEPEVLAAALAPAIAALSALSGAVLLLEPGGQRLRLGAQQGLDARTLWQDGPLTPETPAGDVIADGQARYFEQAGALRAAYPHLEDRTGRVSAVATAILPLRVGVEALGVLILDFREPHHFTADERRFLDTLAGQCSVALDRARLLERLDGSGAQRQLQRRTAELGAERAFLDTVLNSLGEAVIVCDAQGQLVRFNHQARLMHSQDAQPMPPEDWAAAYHLYAPDLSRPLRLTELPLYRALHGETVQDAQLAICVPRQPEVQVLVNAQPLTGPDGAPSGAVVTQRDVTQRHRQAQALAEQAEALRAFVTFSEAASHAADTDALGGLAMATLQAVIPGSSGVLYERQGDLWTPLSWTADLPPELLDVLRRGLPLDVPVFAETLRTQVPVFVDGWDEAEQGVAHTGQFGTVATYPLTQGGEVRAVLSVAHQAIPTWSEAQRALILALGRSFTLPYERLRVSEQLQQQRDEALRRSQALEGFAVMTRDLAGETDRLVLVRRAQELMLSLLTPGYALYWEQGADRWVLKSQVGDIGDPALQRLVDEHGLPLDTPALHSTWLTGVPHYQDNYAQGADTPAEMIRHVNAATAFRVLVHGQPTGMLAIGLFDQRVWTPVDRAVLETAIYSLGLVLERAEGIAALARSNQELQTSNDELEAFTYSASHDLRTPVRHVRGFTDLALRALGQGQEGKVRRHLGVVTEAADRMTAMIDAMLVLSRVGRADLQVRAVALDDLVRQARQDAELEFPEREVDWEVGPLPTVQGDAAVLQQVLTNLLSNAVKFAAPDQRQRVQVWAQERPDAWTVCVRDHGVGFEPQYAGKLFGAFQRLHTHEQFAGTGIGLATVRRIVTRHGGVVWAEGKPGEGATFGFTLPKGPVMRPA